MNKTQKHEIDRVNTMTDEQLWTRYGKMTKPDKIVAFHEALVQESRVDLLQKEIAKKYVTVDVKKSQPEKSQEKKMEFVRVVHNDDDKKAAIFFLPENKKFYLYSYINNDYGHETMVFACDEDGEVDNHNDLAFARGYEHSSDMMDRLMEAVLDPEDYAF